MMIITIIEKITDTAILLDFLLFGILFDTKRYMEYIKSKTIPDIKPKTISSFFSPCAILKIKYNDGSYWYYYK